MRTSYQAAARHLHALEDKEPILGLCPDGQLLLQVWIDGHTSSLVDKEEASKEDQGGHRRRAQFWAAPSLPSHAAATRLACLRCSLRRSSLSLSSHVNGGAVVVSPPACTLPKRPYGSSAHGTRCAKCSGYLLGPSSDHLSLASPTMTPTRLSLWDNRAS